MGIVIESFACKKTKRLFEKGSASGFLEAIKKQAARKLSMLHFAARLDDLRMAPGNRLESLKGKRKGQWSIRINDKYRICFRFENGNACEVEITDYH
ncbi:MAG: plasmid maintenance system killer protein [bacterium]|nr:MAG: plasmid maintenance system killer protein [bacterium]